MSGNSVWFEKSRPGCKGCIHCGPTFPCEFILNNGHSPSYYGVKLPPKGIGCPLKDEGTKARRIVPLKIGSRLSGEVCRDASQGPSGRRGRRPAIDPAAFQQLYEAGKFDSAIAKELGVSKHCVCKYRQRRGLPSNYQKAKAENPNLKVPRRKRSVFDAPEIMEAYKAGAGDQELAALAGTSVAAVRMWRQRRSLPCNYLLAGKKKESSGEREI